MIQVCICSPISTHWWEEGYCNQPHMHKDRQYGIDGMLRGLPTQSEGSYATHVEAMDEQKANIYTDP